MIVFEKLEIKHCRELSELEKNIFGQDAWTEDDFKETLCCDYAYYLVAKDGETVVGSAGLRNMCGDADITNVMIREDYRRQGIARKMLKRLMEDAKEIGVRNYTLEVRRSNLPAIKLYEKIGFKFEGVRPGFYEHPREDALIYWLRTE